MNVKFHALLVEQLGFKPISGVLVPTHEKQEIIDTYRNMIGPMGDPYIDVVSVDAVLTLNYHNRAVECSVHTGSNMLHQVVMICRDGKRNMAIVLDEGAKPPVPHEFYEELRDLSLLAGRLKNARGVEALEI